jgi:hypothetical protein
MPPQLDLLLNQAATIAAADLSTASTLTPLAQDQFFFPLLSFRSLFP